MEYYTMETKLDKKDLRILDLLKENAHWSVKQIAKKAALPITTAHNRIKKLEKSGVIKKYTVLIDNKKIGKMIRAIVAVNADYQHLKEEGITQIEVAKKLREFPEVEDAFVVTGRKDIVMTVSVKDMEDLREFLYRVGQNIRGITMTETFVAME
jgi:Lrp/AsnC family transcriptional regulator, leucine-responsive regulatory protein